MIIVSVVSSVVVLAVGLAIGHYIWKNRYIQKKRKGKKIMPICPKLLCFALVNQVTF